MSLSFAPRKIDETGFSHRGAAEDAVMASLAPALAFAQGHAASVDRCGAVMREEFEKLVSTGVLLSPLPPSHGGLGAGTTGLGAPLLVRLLRAFGYASLPLGRLFEGHVNALHLISRYGTAEQTRNAAREAAQGKVFGVWNTQGADGLQLYSEGSVSHLKGAKTFASGAGFLQRPLVTARTPQGEVQLVLPRIPTEELEARADLSSWTATGMRASATGRFEFSGLIVRQDDLIGQVGDYERQPTFSAGAWRFLAVQLGGMERLLDEARTHLVSLNRLEDPHQLSRMGEAVIAVETARLWVSHAAERAELSPDEAAVAYVNLARCAVERAGLDLLEHVNRSVGLAGFLAPHPVERISRDLSTYLRQPGPDRALVEGARAVMARHQL